MEEMQDGQVAYRIPGVGWYSMEIVPNPYL